MKRLFKTRLPVFAAMLLIFSGTVRGQACAPGELRVFVVDSQEGPVFDAQVRITSDSGTPVENVTQTSGIADFAKVPCGAWSVIAAKAGFEAAVKAVQISTGTNVEVSLTLNPKMQVSSLDVTDTAPAVEQSSTQRTELRPAEVKTLPNNPATVSDTLPLVPGVVRSPDGELKVDGTGEQRSSLVVNQTDVTDPATGKFGQTIPVDAVETLNVLNTPFLAQYGRFTAAVIAVETKRGGEKWHVDLNDPFPDFRIRSYHMRGIRNETPRFVLGGPLIHNRLYINTAIVYFFDSSPVRTLPFPHNESRLQSINSFTQLDLILSPKQILTATLHVSPQHTNFVNLDYFNPEPVTPTYAQHNYIGTIAHHLGIFNGILDSSVSIQRFDALVGAQGSADMVLTPTGNSGNYFADQNRSARRQEWLETWSPTPVRFLGTHLLKTGTSLTWLGNDGQFTYRPVDILNNVGQILERIDFTNRTVFSRTDLEFTVFLQDHWVVNSKLAFDYGARVEHQRLASSLRIAPRAGFAWTPFSNERTVFRAGWGQFYDHIPLDVYVFGRYPERTLTFYNPDGSIIGQPIEYVNVIGSVTGPRSFLVRGQQVTGGFAPRGITYNVQLEHRFSKLLHIRATYSDNRSVGLITFEPDLLGTTNEIVLNGDGSSRYRQAEVTAKFAWRDGQQMVLSYTRSRAEGNLNSFDTYLGNFPTPQLRPVVYSNLPADLPNRFLAWGHVKVPFWKLEMDPIVEYRNGFPYAQFDANQNYVGVPNSDKTRFPNFFSADARLARDFRITPKYAVRLSVTGFNLTNHFNALAIHSNTADPQFGVFFGNYHRRYRFDFDFIF
jgi:Carboxypeptidase regulatory-like domain